MNYELFQNPSHELGIFFCQLHLQHSAALLILRLSKRLRNQIVLIRLTQLNWLWQLLMMPIIIMTSFVITSIVMPVIVIPLIVIIVMIIPVMMFLGRNSSVWLFIFLVRILKGHEVSHAREHAWHHVHELLTLHLHLLVVHLRHIL